MNKEIKKCKNCNRIITNPKNKTGLCSECEGKGVTFLAILTAIIFAIPRTIKFIGKNMKNIISILKK